MEGKCSRRRLPKHIRRRPRCDEYEFLFFLRSPACSKTEIAVASRHSSRLALENGRQWDQWRRISQDSRSNELWIIKEVVKDRIELALGRTLRPLADS